VFENNANVKIVFIGRISFLFKDVFGEFLLGHSWEFVIDFTFNGRNDTAIHEDLIVLF